MQNRKNMKKPTTRSLLIDPVAKSVTEIMVPRIDANNHIHKLIGCKGCDRVDFGNRVMLSIDDFGLSNVTQGFFVIHVNGVPRHFISGKGVLWAYNAEGETVDLPAGVTPALIRQHVAFVADHHRTAAADLCAETLTRAGITGNPAEFSTQKQRYNEIVRRAMALTEK
jgi:hypothetical protein